MSKQNSQKNPELQRFYKLKELSNSHIEYFRAQVKFKNSQKRFNVISDIVNKYKFTLD